MKLENFSIKTKKRNLLSNVSIEFEKGKMAHVLGKNGTGKTCLAKSIIGAFPFSGKILLDEKNICIIGSYTNIPNDLKVKDVMNIITKKFKRQISKEVLDIFGIKDMPLKNKMKNLSDGQRQKIKLLYFLSTAPEIIIFDEFTNALDKKTCLEIYEFINNYREKNNTTIINITHNITDLEYMDGEYFLIENENIRKYETKEFVINSYIKG